jgi:XTP/dITP diphosphohydrolase
MKSLLFASHNQHKIREVQSMLSHHYTLLGLHDVGLTEDIPEPHETFAANAQAKALYAFKKTGIPAFSDDSGLEVQALHHLPGVRSARYAGPQKSDHDNMIKLLTELEKKENRQARFITVFAFQENENECHYFSGMVEGSISLQPIGDHGFGYDPIFIPSGFDKSFGQLDQSIKKAISHRAKAMAKLLAFLAAQST